MISRFRHAALVGKYQAHGMRPLLEEIGHLLTRRGLEVSVEIDTAQNTGLAGYPTLTPDELGRACDLAVVVGGDGTMLGIARTLARYNVPMVGINQGRLGFITDISVTDVAQTLRAMLAGDYEEEHRAMLEGCVVRDGESIYDAVAMNDVVLRSGTTSMVELRVEVDGQFVANFRADGLIVSSPTGSTAYALSAGGPILTPQLPAFLLVPVAPHALTHRPIAIGDDAEIVITVIRGRDAGVHCDGQSHFALAEGDCVRLKRAAFHARFLYPEGHDYFAMLREKLHWSATPERITRPPAG